MLPVSVPCHFILVAPMRASRDYHYITLNIGFSIGNMLVYELPRPDLWGRACPLNEILIVLYHGIHALPQKGSGLVC